MNSLLKTLLRRTPGVAQLDDFLCRRYSATGRRDPNSRGSYLSPLPALDEVQRRASELFRRDLDALPGIDLHAHSQLALLRQLAAFDCDFTWSEKPVEGRRYYTPNGWFEEGDAFAVYAMLRHLRPNRVIEVGSGFSSALMLDTCGTFLGKEVRLAFIEPRPVRLRLLLRPEDYDQVEIIEADVQNVSMERFAELGPGDILFIDSSHVTRIGSDVNHLLFSVLPRLCAGVIIHFHDIFWPFEYPQDWLVQGYAWNEAYILRAFLQYNEAFEVMLFNNYLVERHPMEVAKLVPRLSRVQSCSLWLRKVAA